MTRNQIEFANVKELARHNLATEQKEIQSLAEAVRHNQADEGVNWYNASTLANLRQAQESNLAEQGKLYSSQRSLVEAQATTESYKPELVMSETNANRSRSLDYRSQIENRLKAYNLNAKQTEAAIAKIEAEIARSKAQTAYDIARVIDMAIDDLIDIGSLLSGSGKTGQSNVSGISYLLSP